MDNQRRACRRSRELHCKKRGRNCTFLFATDHKFPIHDSFDEAGLIAESLEVFLKPCNLIAFPHFIQFGSKLEPLGQDILG